MRVALCFFLLVSLSASPSWSPQVLNLMVVWNVGQGQWITEVSSETCRHFDVGGEFLKSRQLLKFCRQKINRVYLSHWDWDHIGLLPRLQRLRSPLCLALPPLGRASRKKENLLRRLPSCGEPTTREPVIYSPSLIAGKKQQANALSHVLLFKNILIPADSPLREEKQWLRLWPLSSVRVLILGHHGSRTSSSDELLKALSGLRMAVASARWSRYGHPHPQVVARLKAAHIPLLRTEDWGHLIFEL